MLSNDKSEYLKVVCVDPCSILCDFLEVGKVYDVIHTDSDTSRNHYHVIGTGVAFPKSQFRTIDEYRDLKLTELGI